MVERKRHLAKAVSYRVFGSLATAAIAYVISGRVDVAAGVGIADSVVKVVLYYFHERLWYRIRWGVHPGQPHELSSSSAFGAVAEAKPAVHVVSRNTASTSAVAPTR